MEAWSVAVLGRGMSMFLTILQFLLNLFSFESSGDAGPTVDPDG